jgi:hypothetical protein
MLAAFTFATFIFYSYYFITILDFQSLHQTSYAADCLLVEMGLKSPSFWFLRSFMYY